MRQYTLDIKASEAQPVTNLPIYTPVDYVLPEGTFTNGVRRATPPEPADCHICGSLATDPNPAHLVDDIYLDCPRCPPQSAVEPPERTAAQQLSLDVRDIMAEEAARGSGQPASGGGGRARRKPVKARMEVRFDQEVALFNNGTSLGDHVRISRIETASERFELQLSLDCKERLREKSHDLRNDYGQAYPQVQLVRDAMTSELKRLENPREIERGTPRASLQMRLYPGEVLLIDAAAEYWGMSRHQVVEACLWQLLRD